MPMRLNEIIKKKKEKKSLFELNYCLFIVIMINVYLFLN
jgi:hypothetical protein